MQENERSSITLAVVEATGRNVLLSGAQRACDSLACRRGAAVRRPNILCVSPTKTDIRALIREVPNITMMIATVKALSGTSSAIAKCEVASAVGAKFAVAEQSVGSPPLVWSAGQILSLVHRGTTAVFREYDFVAEDTILHLLLEHIGRSEAKAILIGEPATRVKALLEEVTLEWNDPDTGMVFRPEVTFRVASALTQVPQLDSSLDTREKVAYELNSQGWFPYNFDDTRKAVGSLARAWDLHTRTLHILPQEARRRGFPHPNEADALFDFIERIDTDERIFTSASGTQFEILYIFNM